MESSATPSLVPGRQQAMEYSLILSQRPATDDFSNGLGRFWSVHNRTGQFSVSDPGIDIATERGDLPVTRQEGSGRTLKNYLSQPAAGSWESVVRIGFNEPPGEKGQYIGLMIMQDPDNYLHFRHEGRCQENDAAPAVFCLSRKSNGKLEEVAEVEKIDGAGSAPETLGSASPDLPCLYLKTRKCRDEYEFFVSTDGQRYVQVGGTVQARYTDPRFVLCASNGNSPTAGSITARFHSVEFSPVHEARETPLRIAATGNTKIEAEDYVYKTPTINTQPCEDVGGGLNVGWTAPGQYLLYNIHVEKSGFYEVSPRIASSTGTLSQLKYHLEVDGQVLASFAHGGTGGWQNWASMNAKKIYLEEGAHKMRMLFSTADVNVNSMLFSAHH